MGTPKHLLPFGDETMLQRVVSIVAEVVRPVVVVRAPDMELPDLPAGVLIAEDAAPGLGPLAGLSAGLHALNGRCEAAYATACDAPLLKPAVIRHLIDARAGAEIAVYREDRFHHVLAAVYSMDVLPRIDDLIAAERLRPFFLLEESNTRQIDVSAIRHIDPDGDSFKNANTPDDYETLKQIAGV